MARYVQLEIDQLRRETKQQIADETNSDNENVSREIILEHLRNADSRIQDILLDEIPDLTLFDATTTISVLEAVREYDLPANIYPGCDVKKVEYSYDSDTKNYITLRPANSSELRAGQTWEVINWQLTGNKLVISPVPAASGGLLRVTYTKRLDLVDIRRGKIASTPNDGTSYTQLVLENDTWLEESLFDSYATLCVCASNGTVKYYNLAYTSYDSSTRTFTLAASQLMSAGSIAVGDFIALGEYSTTHSELPQPFDKYRLAYGAMAVKSILSGVDLQDRLGLLAPMEESLINKFRTRAHGPRRIPIINSFWT